MSTLPVLVKPGTYFAHSRVNLSVFYEIFSETLMGSEGWHLDVLKKWMDATEAENTWMRPHGWRFSCRDRNQQVQGYRARYRKVDYICGSVRFFYTFSRRLNHRL